MGQENLFDPGERRARGLAVFDPDKVYRYLLTRQGDSQSSTRIVWVMLNPSTADEHKDDPTIRKITGYSFRWGYGRVRIVNIFALRSTDPKALKVAVKEGRDPVGPENDRWIGEEVEAADTVVCAWGAHGALNDRDLRVYDLIRRYGKVPVVLGLTSAGALGDEPKKRRQPVHPLYQKNDAQVSVWHGPDIQMVPR